MSTAQGKETVVKNPSGECYARDKDGNQLYPNSEKPLARNKHNEEYYARDFQGNEMYPLQQGKLRLAKTSNGTERYPRDAKGNEYYLQWDGESLSLRKPNREHYLAQNRKGF
ncbi:hypothetical protein TNCV_2097721 [Trichonephila clavipes]|nr:hypothetical protein TNCV_2097721 [Trichonephila clavipes]